MIWPLALLWICTAGLAAVLLTAALRLTADEQDVLTAQRAREGLGRCVRRAQVMQAGPGGNRGRAQMSRGISSSAARRS